MAKEHVLVCEAIRAAVWGKPEPNNGYERAMPAKWDMAAGPGSANIPWMAYVAGRHYKRADSRMLEEYVALNKAKYQLSEPLSWIYSGWTVTAQAACVDMDTRTARDRRTAILSHPLAPLLLQWVALCLLMESSVRGKRTVALCGCRSWGHDGSDGYMSETWRVICGDQKPRRRTQAVSWQSDVLCVPSLLEVFRVFRDQLKASDPAWLWSRIVYPMRAPFQFIGYEDGSRVCIMGSDEESFVDEDLNSNTPGVLLYRATPSGATYLPKWPAPNGGFTRLRQTGIRADIDYEAALGRWVLFHSEIGVRKEAGMWVSEVPEIEARRIFHFEIVPAGRRINHLQTLPPVLPPVIPPSPKPPAERDSWWSRFRAWLGRIF